MLCPVEIPERMAVLFAISGLGFLMRERFENAFRGRLRGLHGGQVRPPEGDDAIEGGAAIADVAVALGHTSVEMCRRHYLLSTRAVVERAQVAYSRAIVDG